MEQHFEASVRNTKNFWNKHKGKIAVVATISTIVVVAGLKANMRTTDKFLEEHGLTEEYRLWLYNPEEDN